MALENYKALTIAGSDTSGGAGMEADLKTFEEMGVYGMVALTVIVAQNPKDWAHDIFPIDLPTIERQIATVGEGIGINAMKTGMLGSAALVELVAKSIDKYNFKIDDNARPRYVQDTTYYVVDSMQAGVGNMIPLWLFGFLY